MAQKFLSDIELTRGLKDSSGDLGTSGQILSSTGSGLNWISQGGSSVIYQDGFTGNGTTTAFTLSATIDNENKTQVYLNGVYQHKDTYSLNGTTLTFSTAPPNSSDIEVISFASVSTSVIDGSGTANDIVMWQDSDTLTDAPIAISGNNATFAGDVTATSKKFISTSSSSGDYIRLYAGSGTGEWDIYGHGNNLRFSENSGVSGALIAVDTGATFAGGITTTSATGIKIDTTANAILELDGASGSTEAIIFRHLGTEVSRISHSNSTNLVFSTGSSVTTALTLDTSQNATFAGNIYGNDRLYLGTKMALDVNGTDLYLGSTTSANHNDTVYIRTNDANRVTITDSSATFVGNVGIGTTSPSATLNIKSLNSLNSDSLSDVITKSEFKLQYRADDLSSMYLGGLGSERGYLQSINNAENAGSSFSLNPYGGNVGIGTTSPDVKLDVNGAIYADGLISSFSGSNQGYFGMVSAENRLLNLSTSGTTLIQSNSTITLNVVGSNPMVFKTTNTERMRIDSSGNIGVGVTTESWGTSGDTKAIQISTMTSLSEAFDGTQLASNFYFNGTNDKYIQNDFATSYLQIDGTHRWRYAASGTADANITWSEAMRIDSSGSLLVNTTSAGSNRLKVVGDASRYGILSENLSGYGALSLKSTTVAQTWAIGALDNGSNSDLFIYGGSSAGTKVTLQHTGNVGIGTTSPSQKLAVIGEVSLKSRLFLQRSGAGATTLIQFRNENGVDKAHIDFGGTNEELGFFAGAGSSEHMRITSAGNVGIGTTSPTQLLTVWGGNVYLRGGDSKVIINNIAGASNNEDILFQRNDSTQFILGLNSSDSFTLFGSSTSTSRLTVNSSGNVGIGTTSPIAQLDIAGNTNQHHSVSTTHNGGFKNIQNLGASGWLDQTYSAGRLKVFGYENGSVNISYCEYYVIRHNSGYSLNQIGTRLSVGNGHGQVDVQISGNYLQVKNALNSSLGVARVVFSGMKD